MYLQRFLHRLPGVDYIFHAAALKQVPSCKFFPMQAVKTNVEGMDNVLDFPPAFRPAFSDLCM